MATRKQAGQSQEAGVGISDPRSLLWCEVAKLTKAECREVSEYIDIMRSLRSEGDSLRLFGDGFGRRLSAMSERGAHLGAPSPADTTTDHG